jgi:hypothetical protein
MLLEHGADVNTCHFDERSALFIACCLGRADIATTLLDANADPSLRPLWQALPSEQSRLKPYPALVARLQQLEKALLEKQIQDNYQRLQDQTRNMRLA